MLGVSFPKNLPDKVCANPDCKKKDFTPIAPFQVYCGKPCRMHVLYLTKTKPRRQAARREKERGPILDGEKTPGFDHHAPVHEEQLPPGPV